MSQGITGGTPFWSIKDGIPQSYTELTESLNVDILVLGSGITGSLVARGFARSGNKVAVIDKRRIAYGSTAASTALLQYEIDIPLSELMEKIGKEKAERAYIACAEAIDEVQEIAKEYPNACFFKKKPSVYLAARKKDIKFLKKEFEARKEAGLNVRWLEKNDLRDEFEINAEAAICSEQGGEVDPYLLAHSILKELQDTGHYIYERTEIDTDSIKTEGGISAKTTTGHTITAKKIVFATGYESVELLKEKIVELNSSYAFVTEKILENPKCHFKGQEVLLWDTDKPYLYARTTQDGRLLIGGEDIGPKNMILRDVLIPYKIKKLVKKYSGYMLNEDLKTEMKVAFSWSGTFGETKDGLAYIGESPEWNNAYFALGFGGNGILYSVQAGRLLTKLYKGEKDSDLELYRFGR